MEEEKVEYTGRFEQIMVEIWNYLASKFEDLPEHEIQEISAYLANRFGVAMMDMVAERDRDWNRYVRKLNKTWENKLRTAMKKGEV